MDVMLSQRNKPLFVRGNYKFAFQKNLKGGVQRWNCNHRKDCKAYIKFSSESTVIEVNDQHTHSPLDDPSLDRERMSKSLKIKAENDIYSRTSKLVFNVKFVGEVEKYPQLYDYTLKEYSKRDATERAWNHVAKEMDMSVSECKEKWRNLRSTFAKNLKLKKSGSGRPGKNPYYLMEAMQFAIPFIKVSGNPSGNLPYYSSPAPDEGEVDVGQDEDNLSTEDLASPEIASPVICYPGIASPVVGSPEIASPAPSQQDQATPGPSTGTREPHEYPVRKRKLGRAQGDAEKAISDYFAAEKVILASKEGSNRGKGIRHFLLSLMPDLVQMNDVQLKKFKRRALELVEEVCEKPA